MNSIQKKEAPFDLIVIGGGPAGMMAAGAAAARGARVLLLEKNPSLGKKLLITGGGRCNVTNGEENARLLLKNYKNSAKFLFSAFAQYGVTETLTFFHDRGLATKVEDNQRVFPITDKAESVFKVMVEYLRAGQVVVECDAVVEGFTKVGDTITAVRLKAGRPRTATSYLLATGGLSRPETGSTGDGFKWLSELGHTVATPDASLVPIALKDVWIKKLAGVALDDVQIRIMQNGIIHAKKTGRILCTHVGLSGPLILNQSKVIGELLDYGEVTILLDLFPKYDVGSLDQELITLFHNHSNKQLKNTLPEIMRHSMSDVVLRLSGLAEDQKCHSITKEERRALTTLLKNIPLQVSHLLGTDKAIITSGGVALEEMDFRTMRSRKISNLFVVGDLLNIDRPSGGFSLQLCWTTGYVAGKSVPIKA